MHWRKKKQIKERQIENRKKIKFKSKFSPEIKKITQDPSNKYSFRLKRECEFAIGHRI